MNIKMMKSARTFIGVSDTVVYFLMTVIKVENYVDTKSNDCS